MVICNGYKKKIQKYFLQKNFKFRNGNHRKFHIYEEFSGELF